MVVTFAQRLKAAREAVPGLSCYRLAKDSQVSESLLGKFERGEVVPSNATLERLADHLRVSVSVLIDWANEERARRSVGEDAWARLMDQNQKIVQIVTGSSGRMKKSAPIGTPIATYLMAHRERLGVASLDEYAQLLGIASDDLGRILDGRRIPTADLLQKFSIRLGVDVSELATLVEKPLGDLVNGDERLEETLYARVKVPHYGQVGCGPLLYDLDHPTSVSTVPAHLIRDEDPAQLATLEAAGDSMLNAGIRPGDTLIVRRQAHGQDGDIVIANVPHLGSTCKRLRKRKDGSYELVAESPTPYTPIVVVDGVNIMGKVIRAWSERVFA